MTFWRHSSHLVLASKSASRQALLRAACIPFEVIVSDINERAVEQSAFASTPAEVAQVLAVAKAQAVSQNEPSRYVIGADQTLAIGSRRLSKPRDRMEAREHLRAMSGTTHELHSAFTLVQGGKTMRAGVATARMTMRALSEDMIEAYLDEAGEDVLKSVGAYQLEGLGLHLFDRIEGDYFTILGLPMLLLLAALRDEALLLT